MESGLIFSEKRQIYMKYIYIKILSVAAVVSNLGIKSQVYFIIDFELDMVKQPEKMSLLVVTCILLFKTMSHAWRPDSSFLLVTRHQVALIFITLPANLVNDFTAQSTHQFT